MRLAGILVPALLFAQQYTLGPDSQPKPGVPKGKIVKSSWRGSKIFPGTGITGSIFPPSMTASVVNYLIGRYGFENFREARRTLQRGADARNREGFARLFGTDMEEVEPAWLASLKEAHWPPVPAVKMDGLAAGNRWRRLRPIPDHRLNFSSSLKASSEL